MTKAELFTLLPPNGSLETEEARGRFAAALRLRDALLPAGLFAAVGRWFERQRTVESLEALPDAVLRDIGLTRSEIDRAAEEAAITPVPEAPQRALSASRGLVPHAA
jgi:uncharacterized protein YjiS (DUF1127 family)